MLYNNSEHTRQSIGQSKKSLGSTTEGRDFLREISNQNTAPVETSTYENLKSGKQSLSKENAAEKRLSIQSNGLGSKRQSQVFDKENSAPQFAQPETKRQSFANQAAAQEEAEVRRRSLLSQEVARDSAVRLSGARQSDAHESKVRTSESSNLRTSNRFSDLYNQAPQVPETTESAEPENDYQEEPTSLRDFIKSRRFVVAVAVTLTFVFVVFASGLLFRTFERRDLFDGSSTFTPIIEEYASFEERDRAFAQREFGAIKQELLSRREVDSREFERRILESYTPRVWKYVLELRENDAQISASKFIDSENFVSEHWNIRSE